VGVLRPWTPCEWFFLLFSLLVLFLFFAHFAPPKCPASPQRARKRLEENK